MGTFILGGSLVNRLYRGLWGEEPQLEPGLLTPKPLNFPPATQPSELETNFDSVTPYVACAGASNDRSLTAPKQLITIGALLPAAVSLDGTQTTSVKALLGVGVSFIIPTTHIFGAFSLPGAVQALSWSA